MKFYLGVPRPLWLRQYPGIPYFISRRQMPKRKFPKAESSWALDSGGFTELQKYGKWTVEPKQYVEEVNKYAEFVGNLDWASQQDWMCEPIVISGGRVGPVFFEGTKLSVLEHQQRTVDNFLELDGRCSVPIIPVIQGFTMDEYHYCIDLFSKNGVDLTTRPVVGVGSICRRQATSEAAAIIKSIYDRGISIHGFGLKKEAVRKVKDYLTSADSMAWSFNARRLGKPTCDRLNGKTGQPIKNCANCYHAAYEWYRDILRIIKEGDEN